MASPYSTMLVIYHQGNILRGAQMLPLSCNWIHTLKRATPSILHLSPSFAAESGWKCRKLLAEMRNPSACTFQHLLRERRQLVSRAVPMYIGFQYRRGRKLCTLGKVGPRSLISCTAFSLPQGAPDWIEGWLFWLKWGLSGGCSLCVFCGEKLLTKMFATF